MAHVTRRPLAAADILDIRDHIAEDSMEQADRWVNKLDE
jgi:toxin ParE1/3/4